MQAMGLGEVAADFMGLWSALSAVLLMLVVVLLSLYLSLGIHRDAVIATIRGVVQMTVLAYILTPGFALNRWWLTLVYSIVLLLVSSAEAVSRPPAAYEGMLMHVLVSMGVSVALVLLFGILLVFKPSPWYDVRILLPAVALFLSNAISSISIGLSTALTQLTTEKATLEMLLAIGASRMEALQGSIQCSLQAALMPSLNQLSVIGLVSLPEFFGGQLAFGAAPLQASQLQLAVILLSIVCAALASTAAVYACILVAVDQQHMLRGDRLLLRHGREAGVAHWIHSQSIKGWKAARARCHKVVARLQAVAGVRSRSYRQRGQVGGGSGWLMKSPLARRMFSREQGEDYDEVGSLDSRLRGVAMGGSDDEQESVFSVTFSEAEDSLAGGHRGATGPSEEHRNNMTSPRRSEPG